MLMGQPRRGVTKVGQLTFSSHSTLPAHIFPTVYHLTCANLCYHLRSSPNRHSSIIIIHSFHNSPKKQNITNSRYTHLQPAKMHRQSSSGPSPPVCQTHSSSSKHQAVRILTGMIAWPPPPRNRTAALGSPQKQRAHHGWLILSFCRSISLTGKQGMTVRERESERTVAWGPFVLLLLLFRCFFEAIGDKVSVSRSVSSLKSRVSREAEHAVTLHMKVEDSMVIFRNAKDKTHRQEGREQNV